MADKNFDVLLERLQRKIYGGVKGQIRLHVLRNDLSQLSLMAGSSRILDAGCGLGQIGIDYLKQGFDVVFCDVSQRMLEGVRCEVESLGLLHRAEFICSSIQNLSEYCDQSFDLVLCHAVLEWVDEPEVVLRELKRYLVAQGVLSLMVYNVNSIVHSNSIKGNLYKVKAEKFKGYPGSLTPQNPLLPEQVREWLGEDITMMCESGVRCFYDYMPLDVQKNRCFEDIIELEMRYCQQMPFKDLGRYVHFLMRLAD